MAKTEIDKINDKLDSITDDVHTITRYLYHDTKTNTKGLIQKVEDMRKDIDDIKQAMNISMAKKSVWVIVLTAIGTGIGFLLKVAVTKLHWL